MTASGHDQSPRNSLRGRHARPPLRHTLARVRERLALAPAVGPSRLESGTPVSTRWLCTRSTRGTGDWHVYTAVFDQRKSEVFVDGYCEASGKNVGANCLDGLSIGCAPPPVPPAHTRPHGVLAARVRPRTSATRRRH